MIKERIERLGVIAKETGIDIKILPHKSTDEETVELVAERLDLDEKIRVFKKAVSEGLITDKSEIRAEIDRFLELLGHTMAIDHLPAARKAMEINNSLTEEQGLELFSIIEEIKKFRARIIKKAKEYNAGEICGKCGGRCCERDIEKMISEMDFFYMFYVLREEQIERIWETLKMPDNADANCRFQGKNGCTIPEDGRPGFCQAHYCEEIPVIGETETGLYADTLVEGLGKAQEALGGMGFDLKCAE